MEADRVVSKCLDTLTEQKTQQEQILLRLLKALGEESYRQADQLMALLERAL